MPSRRQSIQPEELQHLCDVLLTKGVNGGSDTVALMAAQGHTQRSIYLNILAEAARRLGSMWDQDQTTFLGVQVASARIEDIIRETAQRFAKAGKANGKSAVFAPVPEEEHTIGLKMATELHRAKGWDIRLVVRPTHNELVSLMRASQANILGLSIGSLASMTALYPLVQSLKAHRPELKILVCGSLVATNEKAILQSGVDACASTLGQAERRLEKLAKATA